VSVSVTVLTTQTKLPTTEGWQKALDINEFKVKLDATCEVVSHEGFWPATYQGRTAGFELYRSSPDEFLGDYPNATGAFDVAVSFVTHSNMDEGCSAWLAASALAHLTGGVLLDESAGEDVPAADALSWGRAVEAEASR
jgi:hypothetical protein